MRQVKVAVKVNGQVFKQQVEQVDGNLKDMEEKIVARPGGGGSTGQCRIGDTFAIRKHNSVSLKPFCSN